MEHVGRLGSLPQRIVDRGLDEAILPGLGVLLLIRDGLCVFLRQLLALVLGLLAKER